MYREIRAMSPDLDAIDGHLRAALKAADTRETGTESTAAQAILTGILDQLKELSRHEQESDVDARFVQAAIASLNSAWSRAQKVAMGAGANQMRDTVIDFKTDFDFARAYLRAAIGSEEV
ncbi:MAG: hypothetical protein ACRDFX_04445 [Chloroflexota bacterium]